MLKLLKRLAVTLLTLCVLLIIAHVFRAPLLRGAANAWSVSDPLSRSDVIVVLGGGLQTRPFEAARLFHQGLAPKILLTNPELAPLSQLGLTPTEADLARAVLLKKEVPDQDIFVTAETVSNTHDESIAVRNWAKTNGVKRVIISTDFFHTRRARWTFCKALKPLGIQVEMDGVPAREYAATNWWRHEEGVVAFQNEILKYAYYRIKY